MNTQSNLPKVSLLVPLFNESESLDLLVERIDQTMNENGLVPYELIFIDDGSTDDSWQKLNSLYAKYHKIMHLVRFRKNCGKSIALAIGTKRARADILITMDADLQDDPRDIPHFVAKLEEGYDFVSGWKKNRHDPVNRLILSWVFNRVTSLLTGVNLKDFNCGFKAYRRLVFDSIDLYGDLHRFIPVLLDGYGFKVAEIQVNHNPRSFGYSKYGLERIPKGFLDLLTVLMITRFSHKPSHLIGLVGLIFGVFGVGALTYLVILWFLGFRPIGTRPLLLLGVLATLLSVQLITTGLLAELLVNRTKIDQGEKMVSGEVEDN